MLHICRSAAKTRLISAMDFVNRLKVDHLQAFWHFASKVNFALVGTFGSLLWATSPNVQEAEFYKARLAEYRWTLRVSAKSAQFMEFAVGVLDVGIGRVQQEEWLQRRNLSNGVQGDNGTSGGGSIGAIGHSGIVGLGMGVGMGVGMHGDTAMSGVVSSGSMGTGSGIASPVGPSHPPFTQQPSHMSPPVTGDEMDQDDDEFDDENDADEDDDEGHAYDHNRPGHAGFRIGHGSDHDVDMEFMGDTNYGYGGEDDDDDDSGHEEGTPPYRHYPPHPPLAIQDHGAMRYQQVHRVNQHTQQHYQGHYRPFVGQQGYNHDHAGGDGATNNNTAPASATPTGQPQSSTEMTSGPE